MATRMTTMATSVVAWVERQAAAIAHRMVSNSGVGQPHQSEVLVIVSLRKHSVDPGLSYPIGSDSAQGADMQGPNGPSD